MERTTDLEVIRERPRLFTWGTILHVHDIGSYTIVEYKDNKDGKPLFHVYVDNKSTNTSTTTLEGALVYAIAYKHLEINEALARSRVGARS